MWRITSAPRRCRLRFSKRAAAAGVVAAFVAGGIVGRGELEEWVQHTPAGPLIAVFFRTVSMPGGPVPIRRAPSETRPELGKMIASAPRDAALYRLRA